MSIKKAQKIVNDVDHELGISLVAFQNNDLEYLKKKLEDFLELEIETEELQDADDARMDEEFETEELEDLED